MTPRNDLLLVAGKALTIILQMVVGFGAAVVAIVIPILTLASGDILDGFADGAEIDIASLPLGPTIALLGILFAVLAALFVFFAKLRAIIDTVSEGEPFVPANADRLNLMAWLMLATQVLLWPAAYFAEIVAGWASTAKSLDIAINRDNLDLTGILLILVLFILARVFRHGAAMREDLEGTV